MMSVTTVSLFLPGSDSQSIPDGFSFTDSLRGLGHTYAEERRQRSPDGSVCWHDGEKKAREVTDALELVLLTPDIIKERTTHIIAKLVDPSASDDGQLDMLVALSSRSLQSLHGASAIRNAYLLSPIPDKSFSVSSDMSDTKKSSRSTTQTMLPAQSCVVPFFYEFPSQLDAHAPLLVAMAHRSLYPQSQRGDSHISTPLFFYRSAGIFSSLEQDTQYLSPSVDGVGFAPVTETAEIGPDGTERVLVMAYCDDGQRSRKADSGEPSAESCTVMLADVLLEGGKCPRSRPEGVRWVREESENVDVTSSLG